MAENSTENKYSTLIEQAITSFDNIFTALANKSVKNGSNDSAESLSTIGVSGGIPVANYPSLITNQLFRVASVYSSSGVANNNGIISNYSGQSQTANSTSINYNGSSVIIDGIVPNAGYYDTSSTISSTLSSISLSETDLTLNSAKTAMVWEPSSETTGIVGSISVKTTSPSIGGSRGISYTDVSSSNTLTYNPESSSATLVDSVASGKTLEDYYTVSISSNASITKTVASNSAVSIVAGYLQNNFVDTAITDSTTWLNNGNKTFYIPKATIGNVSGTSTLTVAPQLSEPDLVIDSTRDGYYQVANVNLGAIQLTGSITEGYIKNGSISGTVGENSAEVHVKRGHVQDISITPNSLSITNPSSLILNSTDSTAYSVTVGNESKTESGQITKGLIVEEDSYSATVEAASKTLSIPKGNASATINSSASSNTISGSILSTTSSAGAYEITASASVALTGSTKEGYVKSADITRTGGTINSATYYIKKGSITQNNISSTITFVNGDGKDDGSLSSGDNLFLTTAPAEKDYYQLDLSATASASEGYLTGSETANKSLHFYVPKAAFSCGTDTSTGASFVEVTSAGYIPSGRFTDVGKPDSSVTYASVVATLANSAGILSTTNSTGAYEITLSKNTSATTAGFISGSQGTLTLDSHYYIPKGAISATASVVGLTSGNVTANLDGGVVSSYSVAVSGTAKASATVSTAGYVDTSVSGSSTAPISTTVTIDALELETASTSIASSVSLGSMQAGSSSTNGYAVTPSASATFTVDPSTAGYANSEYSYTGNIANTQGTVAYVKKGTTTSLSAGTKTLSSSNFSLGGMATTTDSNGYAITLSGSPVSFSSTGTLAEGYYGSSEKSLTVSGAVALTSFKIKHGAVSAVNSGSISISSSDVQLYSSGGVGYYAISTNHSLTNTPNVTEGYIKSADVSAATDAVTDGTVYVKKINLTTTTSSVYVDPDTVSHGAGSVYLVTVGDGSNESFLNVEDQYTDKSILVQLSSNATGSDVDNELDRLAARLSGTTLPAKAA